MVQPGGSLELLPSHWIFNPSLSQILRGETIVLLDVLKAKGTTLPEKSGHFNIAFASWTAIMMALLMIILGIVQIQGTCFAPRREIFPLQFEVASKRFLPLKPLSFCQTLGGHQ